MCRCLVNMKGFEKYFDIQSMFYFHNPWVLQEFGHFEKMVFVIVSNKGKYTPYH